MILLHCVNGLVAAWHDDSQTVDPATYGADARIIPWDQPIGNLVKVGEPPADLRFDARPYAQPVETPAILKMYASQVRWAQANGGISFTPPSGGSAIPIKTDRQSQWNITALADHAKTLTAKAPISFTQDNEIYPLQAGDCAVLYTAINTHLQNCRDIEAACIADLNGATPTLLTYDDVDARFASVRK